MPIFMKFEGVDGNVTAKGYEKWIEVQSMQFGGLTTRRSPSRSYTPAGQTCV